MTRAFFSHICDGHFGHHLPALTPPLHRSRSIGVQAEVQRLVWVVRIFPAQLFDMLPMKIDEDEDGSKEGDDDSESDW